MRIIYVGSFRLPFYDAAAARVLNVARALRLAGHEVRFISWGGKEYVGEDGICQVDGFPYVVTNEMDFKGGVIGKIKGWLKQGDKTKKLLKDRLGEYDVVITYNCSLIRWLTNFCKKNNIYLISDLTEWYSYKELKTIQIPGYYWDMLFGQKAVKNKIVISSYFDNYYKRTHNIIVPATCDAREIKWQYGEEKAHSIAGAFDGITLIYAGTPARKDALHFVINAVQQLIKEGANIRFLILGVTRNFYLKNYSSLLKESNLNEHIQFLGRVSQEDVPSFYALADFMVLLREITRKNQAGFPTKFTESFTSGTPVIANITSDLGLYLREGETGFVVRCPDEEAIYKTLKDKVLPLKRKDIQCMKQNVHDVAAKLDYHAFVEPLLNFMNELR